MGIAYAGAARQDIQDVLTPSVADTGLTMEISAMAALSLGFVFVGTGNGEAAGTILQCLMEREDADLNSKWARFMGLGLALLFLGASSFCQNRQSCSDVSFRHSQANKTRLKSLLRL